MIFSPLDVGVINAFLSSRSAAAAAAAAAAASLGWYFRSKGEQSQMRSRSVLQAREARSEMGTRGLAAAADAVAAAAALEEPEAAEEGASRR